MVRNRKFSLKGSKKSPRECAAVVFELKYLPNPRSPSLTTPLAVMKTFAGFISEKKTPEATSRECSRQN